MAGRTTGPIKTKLGIGTHIDPGSVLVKVKVKVIYLCVRYKEFMPAPPGEQNHAVISITTSSSSSAVAAATW